MYPLKNRLSVCREINFEREYVRASFAFRTEQSLNTAIEAVQGWLGSVSHEITPYFPAVDWLRNLIKITENVPAHHMEPCVFFIFSGWVK